VKVVSGLLALSLLAAALVGCGGPKEDVSPATPQSVGNSGAPSQVGGANPGAAPASK